MMKHLPSLAIFILLFTLISCDADMTTRSLKGVYKIDVPKDMVATTGLNPDASLQFENIYTESYLAIIEEDKAAFEKAYGSFGQFDSSKSVISNYAKIQVDFLARSLKMVQRDAPRQLTISGMEAEQIEFIASVDGVDRNIFYLMTFVEGEKHVYMIMTWTFEEFKDDHRSNFISMAKSFKEI